MYEKEKHISYGQWKKQVKNREKEERKEDKKEHKQGRGHGQNKDWAEPSEGCRLPRKSERRLIQIRDYKSFKVSEKEVVSRSRKIVTKLAIPSVGKVS